MAEQRAASYKDEADKAAKNAKFRARAEQMAAQLRSALEGARCHKGHHIILTVLDGVTNAPVPNYSVAKIANVATRWSSIGKQFSLPNYLKALFTGEAKGDGQGRYE